MITGFISPTSGDARLCGISILDRPAEAKMKIGYLPELRALASIAASAGVAIDRSEKNEIEQLLENDDIGAGWCFLFIGPYRVAGISTRHQPAFPAEVRPSLWDGYDLVETIMRDSDSYHFERFLNAQDGIYEQAFSELRRGLKVSHWMWFIFPQIEGLGMSPTAKRYAIRSLDEAREYLKHPVLGQRLMECSRALLELNGKSATDIFGSPDDMKLKSCMTLFAKASPEHSVFKQVIDRYFDGQCDRRTLVLLNV